jgi:hypothetical protein
VSPSFFYELHQKEIIHRSQEVGDEVSKESNRTHKRCWIKGVLGFSLCRGRCDSERGVTSHGEQVNYLSKVTACQEGGPKKTLNLDTAEIKVRQRSLQNPMRCPFFQTFLSGPGFIFLKRNNVC